MPTIDQLRKAPHRFVDCPDCGKIRPRDGKRAKRIKDGEEPATPMLCLPCKRKPENWEHGTPNCYVQKKCRCRVCKDWKRDQERDYIPPADTDLTDRHGTSTAYTKYKCRCEECRAWKSTYEIRYADAYTGECAADDCSETFESRHSSTLFCTPDCGVRQRYKEKRIAATTPVLFDPDFAAYQQDRIDTGAYQAYRRPWRWIPDKVRAEIYEEFNYVCQDCLIQCDYSTIGRGPSLDHVLPWGYFHTSDPMRDHRSNLIVLCRSCNSRKNDRIDSRVWITYLVRAEMITPDEGYQARLKNRILSPRKEESVGHI